jgi:hypothetical protein
MATLLLACTMVGAILTHVFVLREPPHRKCHPDLSAADTDTRRFGRDAHLCCPGDEN